MLEKEKYKVLNKSAIGKILKLKRSTVGNHLKDRVDNPDVANKTKKAVADICRDIADKLDPQEAA